MSVKRYFKLNKNSTSFREFDEHGQILIEEGFEITKKFVAEKAKADGKKTFAEILDGMVKGTEENRNDKYVNKLVKYSLKAAGYTVGDDFDISVIQNPNLNKDVIFRQKFNAVLAQVITPIVPAMISAEYMDMADISNIAWGETAKFKVRSNDSFFVTRMAEGILHGSIQRLYNDEIVVNPEPYNIETAVDWYQVASGVFDLGEFIYKIGISFSNYITLMIITAMKEFITNGLPQAYVADGFTTETFAKLAEIVKAANGGGNIRAYGALTALLAVLPGVGGSTVISNLQMGLGKEWTEMGYLGRYMGVDMVKIPQIMLPNTVNTLALVGVPEDVIYFLADGGYKPVKIVFEGSTVSIDIIPTESPDKEMGIGVTMRLGMTMINASKFGAIKNIILE